MSRRRRVRGDLPQNVEINVTSLVDLAFTLLVIFMITAPMMQGGVEVDIPQADVRPLTSEEGFIVTVARDGQIFMEETAVTLEDLASGLPQLLAAGDIQKVYIRADSLAPYGPVLRVMTTATNSEVPFALVTEPYRP